MFPPDALGRFGGNRPWMGDGRGWWGVWVGDQAARRPAGRAVPGGARGGGGPQGRFVRRRNCPRSPWMGVAGAC